MNTGNFTFEEINLMCIYSTGSRTGLIDSLQAVQKHLEANEYELCRLIDSTLEKLQQISDADFSGLDLIPDFS